MAEADKGAARTPEISISPRKQSPEPWLISYRHETDQSDNRSYRAPTDKTDNDKTDNTILGAGMRESLASVWPGLKLEEPKGAKRKPALARGA